MSKVITPKEHPEEHKQIMGFVQRFKTETEHKVNSQFVSKEALENLISQENFGGLRINYGRDDDGFRQMILEATDNSRNSLNAFSAHHPTCPPECVVQNT